MLFYLLLLLRVTTAIVASIVRSAIVQYDMLFYLLLLPTITSANRNSLCEFVATCHAYVGTPTIITPKGMVTTSTIVVTLSLYSDNVVMLNAAVVAAEAVVAGDVTNAAVVALCCIPD